MNITATPYKGFENNPPACIHNSHVCAKQAIRETQMHCGVPIIVYDAAKASVQWLATAYGSLETSVDKLRIHQQDPDVERDLERDDAYKFAAQANLQRIDDDEPAAPAGYNFTYDDEPWNQT